MRKRRIKGRSSKPSNRTTRYLLHTTSEAQGFTLIELLVVISVIGILAGIAIISFSGAQKQARDSQRKSDLRQYQNALEIFANKNNGNYPSKTDMVDLSSTICSDISLEDCPEDPRNEEDEIYTYRYQSDADGLNYVLWTAIENVSKPTYWVVCSQGRNGTTTETNLPPTDGECPL